MDVFNVLPTMQVPLRKPDVAEMTVCVTFGGPRFGPKFRTICARSEYVTFSTISAIGARELTVSVMFGTFLFGPLVASCRRSSSDHAADIAQER